MQKKPAAASKRFGDATKSRAAWKRCTSSWLWVFVVVGVAGVCYPSIKAGLPSAPPLRFAGLRTLIGGLILLAILPLIKKPLWPRPPNARWILPLALVGTTLSFGSMFLAPKFTTAGIGAVLGNTQPLFVIVLAAIFLKERITPTKAVALGFGLVGVTLLAGSGPGVKGLQWGEGSLLALVSSASAGAATVMMRFVRPGPGSAFADRLAIGGWQLTVAGAFCLARTFPKHSLVRRLPRPAAVSGLGGNGALNADLVWPASDVGGRAARAFPLRRARSGIDFGLGALRRDIDHARIWGRYRDTCFSGRGDSRQRN